MALEAASAIGSAWLEETQAELGLARDPSAFAKWLGPISKGLTLASGIFQAGQMFKASGSYRRQARKRNSRQMTSLFERK